MTFLHDREGGADDVDMGSFRGGGQGERAGGRVGGGRVEGGGGGGNVGGGGGKWVRLV